MKVKAVIFGHDRTNTVRILKPSEVDDKLFKVGQEVYVLDPDRFMVTWTRHFLKIFKRYYATFYYRQGTSKPLPVPNFEELRIDPTKPKDWKTLVDNGISATELASYFNPWFLRQISRTDMKTWEKIQFYVSVATMLGLAYVIYALATGHYHWPISDFPTPTPRPPTPSGGG